MIIKSLADAREYSVERLTKRILHKSDHSTVFVLNFMPGQELPSHQHPGSDVYILVLSGEGEVIVNGEATKVKDNDSIWVDGEEHFAFSNTGIDPVSLYVMLSKIPSESYARDFN